MPHIKIPKKQLTEWQKRIKFGDKKKIKDFTGLGKPQILMALNDGIATQHTISKLKTYFEHVNSK